MKKNFNPDLKAYANLPNPDERQVSTGGGEMSKMQFGIQDSGFRIQDSRFKIQDLRFKIQDSRFKI
jgi:hypothetical protein